MAGIGHTAIVHPFDFKLCGEIPCFVPPTLPVAIRAPLLIFTPTMEAPPTTLADSLLDDLDDLSDVEEQPVEEDEVQDGSGDQPISGAADTEGSGSASAAAVAAGTSGAEEPIVNAGSTHVGTDTGALRPKRRRLLDVDSSLVAHLATVRAEAGDSKPSASTQKEEDERCYHLIVASNKHLSRLRDELVRAHQDLCAAYHPKFPELEDLIADPLQYRAAVLAIGNEMDLTLVNDELNEVLTSNQILTVTVAGSTTAGRKLSDAEMEAVKDAAAYIEEVREAQADLISFLAHGMEGLAPSVCALVGATTAARLVALAGGLAELSRIPSCNLQVIGQVKQSSAARGGMSAAHGRPHSGVLMECDLVAKCPNYLQKKALKTVAAKLALAARCDYVNVESGRTRTADAGKKFRADIEAKIEKWEEPDKAQTVKALPK